MCNEKVIITVFVGIVIILKVNIKGGEAAEKANVTIHPQEQLKRVKKEGNS